MRSSRSRVSPRSAFVSSDSGTSVPKRWPSVRSTSASRYASPRSDLPCDIEYRARDALTTFGWIGTTAKPFSTSVSTRIPEGRSIAMRNSPAGANFIRRVTNSPRPATPCLAVKRVTTTPRSSTTHTACSYAAQSRPTKYVIATPVFFPRPREELADPSLIGSPRRERRAATPCCRSRLPRLSEAANLRLAVERRGDEAVLGEAEEEAEVRTTFVLVWLPTTGRCTSEGAPSPTRAQRAGQVPGPYCVASSV